MTRIRVHRIADRGDPLPLPSHATEGSAGIDLHADADVFLAVGERALVPTGLALEIPAGFEGQIRPRSGLALRHGIGMVNAPATIDSDYRGEVGVILINHGREPVQLRRGDRIAQLVVARYEKVVFEEAQSLSPTSRGAGGFGHTGR